MRIKTKEIILVALFTSLTAVGAFIKIPVGSVPITLQFLFIALSGILLGPYLGALSQLIYVVLGLVGVPLFTAGGGLTYIFNPGFGYLIGFIIGPIIIGKVCEGSKKQSFIRMFLGCILGVLAIYMIGVPYMFMILKCVVHANITFSKALVVGFLVFLPGDIAKSIFAAYLGMKIVPIIKRNR
jgi:biotin transport system substrate-specific component